MPSVLDRALLIQAAENIEAEAARYMLRAQRWATGERDRETDDSRAYEQSDQLRLAANVLRKIARQAGVPIRSRYRA